MKKKLETANEIRHRLLQHWQIAHGRLRQDPECSICRRLEELLREARERERT